MDKINASGNFELLLDTCLAAIVDQGQTVESVLQQHPAQRTELEPYLRTAQALRQACSLRAPGGLHHSRAAALPGLAITRPLPPRPQSNRRAAWQARRPAYAWLAVLILAVLWLAVQVGMPAAAKAMPGEALYSIKLFDENLRVAVAPAAETSGRLELNYASRRLDEAAVLVQGGNPRQIGSALQNYQERLEAESQLFDTGRLSDDDQSNLAAYTLKVLAQQETQLNQLMAAAPVEAQPQIQTAATTLKKAQGRAQAVLRKKLNPKTGKPGKPGQGPALKPSETPEPGEGNVPVLTGPAASPRPSKQPGNPATPVPPTAGDPARPTATSGLSSAGSSTPDLPPGLATHWTDGTLPPGLATKLANGTLPPGIATRFPTLGVTPQPSMPPPAQPTKANPTRKAPHASTRQPPNNSGWHLPWWPAPSTPTP